jgi:site-specific recombinase XerD
MRRVHERIDKPLDQLEPHDLKMYFADLLDTYSWSTIKCDRCALMFFYTHVLEREWQWVKIVKPPRVQTLPTVLTQDETLHLLSQLEKLRYRACLTAIYSMGLRLSEGLRIQPADICSERMRVHIRNTKGKRDRLVPLPYATLQILRKYWATHRNPNFLFPLFLGTLDAIRQTKKHMDKSGVQGALKAALLDSGIVKNVSVHSLRHSYATHLVEVGVNLRVIQAILGHKSLETTAIYTQLTSPVVQNSEEMINLLMMRIKRLLQ